MANYWVTGVWKDSQQRITDLLIHENTGKGVYLSTGLKVSLTKSIEMIDKGNVLTTIRWKYPGWATGEKILVVQDRNGKYLRTRQDAQLVDNLDNMLPM